MPHETDLTDFHFLKGTTPRLDYTLVDENGDNIVANLDTHTASIYDKTSKVSIPTWIDKDIKSAEGNLVVLGVGVWILPTSATVKLTTDIWEDHVIAMEFTYNSGKVGIHNFVIRIYENPDLT